MLLRLNRVGKRGNDREWFLIQTDVMVGPRQGFGASLRLAPAHDKKLNSLEGRSRNLSLAECNVSYFAC